MAQSDTRDVGLPSAAYGLLHEAFTATARSNNLPPEIVRVLVAIRDVEGEATSRRIQNILLIRSNSSVRRALAFAATTGYVAEVDQQFAVAGERKLKQWTLTDDGRELVETFDATLESLMVDFGGDSWEPLAS